MGVTEHMYIIAYGCLDGNVISEQVTWENVKKKDAETAKPDAK